MKPKPIEYVAYGIVGAGCGILAAILVGSIMQATLDEKKLDRFNAVFWTQTVPWLTAACGVAAASTHMIVTALQRSTLQSEASEPVRNPVQTQPPQAFPSLAQSALFPQSNAPAQDVRTQLDTLYEASEPVANIPEQPKSNHPLDL